MNKGATKLLLVQGFIAEHKDDLEPYELEIIKKYISDIDGNFMFYPFVAREIFDKLGLMSDEENLYHRFAELVHEIHDISGKNILEIGGGVYPTFAERLTTKAGCITVYDPRLTKHQSDTDKLKLVRQNFTKHISLAEYDLVLALMPCKGAEALLDACLEQDKDFVLGLCEGGPHGDYHDFYEDDEEWIHAMTTYTDSRLRRDGKGKLLTKTLEGCSYPYPIIYNSRK